MGTSPQDLPLSDVRVIDLTVARAGPTCVRQLADWGADVVRIDVPSDATALDTAGMARHGSDFQNLHRNKRSLSLDLKQQVAHDVLMRLVDGADVIVENMRPNVKERLGFDYQTLSARNPRIVMGSISGFGQTGPYALRGGVDQIAQGLGGLMSVTGMPGSEPTRVGIPISDLASGLHLAIGILAALHERDRTGQGRWVQTSLLESMIAMLDLQATRWTVDHEVPVQEGNHHPTLIPMGCFRSSDGHVNIAGPSGRLWAKFCAAIGLPELLDDARFAGGAARSANRVELNAIIAERLAAHTTTHWVAVLNDAGVPCGPVNTIDQVFADEQVQHLGMVEAVDHPVLGRLDLIRNAVAMSGVGPTVRSASPDPGQHTDEILLELGLSADDITALRSSGAI